MKQTILQFTFSFFILFCATQVFAQVTIDETNYDRLGDYTDSVTFAQYSVLGNPSEGPDQFWDYSDLLSDGESVKEHFDATGNPDFPSATGSYQSNLDFQGLPIPNVNYERVDENGWHNLGGISEDISYNISFLTGGANDTLRFPGSVDLFDQPNELMNFPMTYEDQWTSITTGMFNFELTVAAFGLDKVPGNRKRVISSDREIVGYGQLVMPETDGSPSQPMDVLLMRTDVTVVDSVFLGGAPAPQPLLDAFGLVQGGEFTIAFYFFYKPDFNSSVLFMNADFPSAVSYRPQAADAVNAVRNINQTVLKSFPNPILAGQTLIIQTENSIVSGSFNLTDLTGRVVHSVDFESGLDNQIQVNIPAGIGKGFYTYGINDKQNQPMGFGKILVE